MLLAACLPLTGVVNAWTPPIPPPTAPVHTQQVVHQQLVASSSSRTTSTTTMMSEHVYDWAAQTRLQGQTMIGELFLVPPAFAAEVASPAPPTNNEVLTLQKAFAALYGAQRDPQAALPLLDESITAFQRQPADERAGLYRVRADCQMALKNPTEAIEDYSTAIELLKLPESQDKVDPAELPSSM